MNSFVNRVLDVTTESGCAPIQGLKDAPVLSLQEAIAFAEQSDHSLRDLNLGPFVLCAMLYAQDLEEDEDVLSPSEVGSIHLYTQESPLYSEINRRLRARERILLRPFFPFMRLFIGGLLQTSSALWHSISWC